MYTVTGQVAPELAPALCHALTSHLPDGDLGGREIRELDAINAARWSTASPAATGAVAATLAGVPVRIHFPPRPTGADPVLIWFHGGGMIMGTAAGSDVRARSFSDETGCTVIAPDYRLAPEHPFPAAHEDCLTVAYEVLRAGTSLGVDPTRLAIGGMSAGGNLAAGVALALRGHAAVSLLLLLCPMLDDRTALTTHENRPVWNGRLNASAWRAYLGDGVPGTDGVDWRAAPARSTDLAGLGPVYLDVGSVDLFLAENLDFIARAAAAGVSVEAHVVPGAYHAWDSLVPDAPQSGIAHGWRVAALRSAWNAVSTASGS